MEQNYQPVNARESEVIGLVAYAALAAMTRLAKDGDQAPTIEAHVAHARMSAATFAHFQELEVWAAHRQCDLLKAAEAYSGIFDDLDARTRPTTWRERSVKTYVTLGILTDFLAELTAHHDVLPEATWDLGQGQWVREHVASYLSTEEESARMSLWARRVAGEVFALMRSTMFTHPTLVDTPEKADEIAEKVTRQHSDRMAGLGLRA
ncbi:ferritin-like fold-containing protein [Schaalia sp. lx-260]|uniref:ferritin-like fold-containing protein n=1 Tax=Schaalia sp. lx-260 TaxID=2899082 RepID=UPI001E2C5751|nr:ferritin-like fold-containing protein [Schaalia sp. lx-260]MCD4549087.1 ferritin-like domain-containing protein [Schaalia sp. lx-260]